MLKKDNIYKGAFNYWFKNSLVVDQQVLDQRSITEMSALTIWAVLQLVQLLYVRFFT